MDLLLHAADMLDRQNIMKRNDDIHCVPDISELPQAIPLAKPQSQRGDSGVDSDESRNWPEGGEDDTFDYVERRVPRSRGNRTRAEPYNNNRRTVESHNEVEKRRRAYLSSCYNTLRDVLPSIANSKASNVTVLRTAADEIQLLVAEEQRRAKQLNEMRAYRAKLLTLLGRPTPPIVEELPPMFCKKPLAIDSDDETAEADTDEEAAVPDADLVPNTLASSIALSEQLQHATGTTKSGRRVRLPARSRELF